MSSGGRNNKWPNPGDDYDAVVWHAYDATMATLYLILFVVTASLFVTTLNRTMRKKSKMGKSQLRVGFYLIGTLQTLLRASFFACVYDWRGTVDTGELRLKVLAVLMILPDIFYFSMFSLLLVYWAVVDLTSRGQLKWRKTIQSAAILCNVLLYLLIIVVGIVVSQNPDEFRSKLAWVFCVCVAVFSCIVAVSFLFFGIRLLYKFRSIPPGHEGKTRILVQIAFITACCVFCFSYRAAFVVSIPTRSFGSVWTAATYFLLGELIPISLLVLAFQYFPQQWLKASYRKGGEFSRLRNSDASLYSEPAHESDSSSSKSVPKSAIVDNPLANNDYGSIA